MSALSIHDQSRRDAGAMHPMDSSPYISATAGIDEVLGVPMGSECVAEAIERVKPCEALEKVTAAVTPGPDDPFGGHAGTEITSHGDSAVFGTRDPVELQVRPIRAPPDVNLRTERGTHGQMASLVKGEAG